MLIKYASQFFSSKIILRKQLNQKKTKMQLTVKTILNFKENHRFFVYKNIRPLEQENPAIEVDIAPRKGSRPLCSICGKHCPCYDHLKERMFDHVPLYGFPVKFCYKMRRVNCDICGIVVEQVPWSDGKSPITKGYAKSGWSYCYRR